MSTTRVYPFGFLLFFFAAFGCFLESRGSERAKFNPAIRLDMCKEPAIVVTGLPSKALQEWAGSERTSEQWQALFAVYVATSGERTKQPAMLGSYRVVKDTLRFEPRFPLVRGLFYRVVFHPSRLPGHADSSDRAVEALLILPRDKSAKQTVVAQVYPSKNELPENQLKFYLQFSAPMSRGEAYEHIRLFGPDGKVDARAFLELPQELWDRDGKRFTLLLDPGRIKRGLKPREDLGPVLEAGKWYTLVIDRAWPDAEGNRLQESYRKSFRVLPADETQPDPKTWKLAPPTAGTRAALGMTSPKPLDFALLNRMLWIVDERGEKIPGTIEVTQKETCWRFTPTTPWKSGKYHLVADVRLEDLAGNSIARPFEVDELRPVKREEKIETVQVPFEVK